MSFLLDTNVISEWAAPKPNAAVRAWLNTLDDETVFISAMSVAEIGRGILILPEGLRKRRLAGWFEKEFLDRFDGRCLPVDKAVSLRWAVLMAEARLSGAPLDVVDGLIAATAAVHDLTMMTRNTRDFASCGLQLIDPWQEQ